MSRREPTPAREPKEHVCTTDEVFCIFLDRWHDAVRSAIGYRNGRAAESSKVRPWRLKDR